MNRGLEIGADAADAAQSLILDQVSAGVAVRSPSSTTCSPERAELPVSAAR